MGVVPDLLTKPVQTKKKEKRSSKKKSNLNQVQKCGNCVTFKLCL